MNTLPAITMAELDEQGLQLLPDRDTMFVGDINVTNIVGVNFALAVNAASFQAQANAIAGQALASFGF